MKYIIYTRASLIKKANENPHSHDLQLNECMSIVKDGKYKHFEESNVSRDSTLDKRPVLLQALECLETGDILLVYNAERLSASHSTLDQVKLIVGMRGAHVQSALEPNLFDDNHQAEFMCEIMTSMSRFQVKEIRSKIKKAMQSKIRKGEHLGHIPYGFQTEGKMLVQNAEEQALLDKMQAMQSRGITYRNIAEALNNLGYHNRSGGRSRQGGPWNYRAVHRLLKARPIHQARQEALAEPR